MKKNLLTLLSFLLISVSINATDYTIEPKADGKDAAKSRAIPLLYTEGIVWGSVSQQIYLASELKDQGAEAGNIDAISFYYTATSTAVSELSRPIQIFLMEVPVAKDSFALNVLDAKSTFLYVSNTNKTAGERVYNGALATEAVSTSETKKVTIRFDDSFSWDGESNIVVTIFDMSPTSNTISATGYTNLRFLISKTEHVRFLSKKWMSNDTDNRSAWITDMSNREGEYWSTPASVAGQAKNRSYVNKVDFSISPAAPIIPAPENLSASASTTTATLSWDAVDDAIGYNVQWGTNAGNLDHSATNVATTSLDINELLDGTTYYFAVQTITAGGTSAYSSAAYFETEDIVINYKGISFSKWNDASSIPTSGNYYLSADVNLSGHVTLTGNLNLCFNGHNVYTEVRHIIVPDEKTFAIYDNIGGGRIYGYHVANYPEYGIINVQYGGTLVMSEGAVENLYGTYEDPDDPSKNDDPTLSYAILNNGTLKLSGAPIISGVTADIYLYSTSVITIESGKPLTNSTPYSVYRATGEFTSGWANMNGAKPSDHFTSESASIGVCFSGSEAALVNIINLSESSSNTAIGSNLNQLVNVNLTRSLTASQYNTFCLPFALNNAQLEEAFGAGYDLEEFVEASIDGDVLSLTFNKVTSLTAGKPYLLKPSVNVTNPSFEGVTISATSPVDQESDDYISFHGTYAPTELTGGNKNLLFLGADNELFWPESTANLKGFRAYFEIKGSAAQAAKRARIVKKEDSATGIEIAPFPSGEGRGEASKLLRDGMLLIERDGKTFNAQGQRIK